MEIITALNWRYAVKKFDKSRKVPAETVEKLIEAVRLTPTSLGMQPFRLVVVEDRALLASLDEHCWGQIQPGTCSHLFVLATLKTIDTAYIDKMVNMAIAERDLGDKGQRLRDMVQGFLGRQTEEETARWAAKQAYIGLGQLMTVAAVEGIDTCPMEGFLPAQVDAALGLADKDLQSVLLCPIGYRAEDDHHQHYKKLRVPTSEFTIRI